MSKIYTRNIYFFAIAAALGGFLFGFDIAIISGAMPFFQKYFHLSSMELGFVNSSLLIGCILGSLIAGRVTDEFGRKKILVVVAVLFALTSIGCALAPSPVILVIARFLGGLAVGAVSIASPMYIAEIAPSATRGKLMTFYQLSITAGILVSMFVNFILKDFDLNWRLMFASGMIPSIAFLLMLIKIPETPRFLIKKGNIEGARQVLLKIGDEEYANNIIPEIEASFSHQKEKLSDLWQPGIRKAVITSFVLAILVQITGIAAIIDYAPRILQSAGMSIDLALLNTIGIGVINFVFTIVSIVLIDRLGRKPLYVIGSSGLFLALIALSFIFFHPQSDLYCVFCLVYGTGFLDFASRNAAQ
jgi:SP family arabinose:H+ symporter-like MFS transporter